MMKPEPSAGAPAANQQTAPPTAEDTPFWMKHGTRFVGTSSALAAIVLGALNCITITPSCLLAGILQMIIGVGVVLVEAPCFCMFLDFAQVPSAFFDRKPLWIRAIVYVLISIIPIALCRGFMTFIGSGLIFVSGCLYGVVGLGKKAPLHEMRVKASSSYNLLGKAGGRGAGDIESGLPAPQMEPQKVSGAI